MDENLKNSIKKLIENFEKEAETNAFGYFGGDEYRFGYAVGRKIGIYDLGAQIIEMIER